MKSIGRRTFLRGAAGALAAGSLAGSLTGSLAACGSGSSRSGGSKTLAVRSSGGAYQEANVQAVFEPFTKETGITVQVVNLQYAEMLAQIQQGRPQFDLIDDSMGDFIRFGKENAVQAIDVTRLKNAGTVPKNLITTNSIGKNYWGSVFAYRTDVFGVNPPKTWADFWDVQKLPGGRSLQSTDADIPELEFALLADGVEMDKLYPLDVDRAFAAMDRIKPDVTKFWDTGALPGVLLGRKEVVLASVWHGRLDSLITDGAPLAYQFAGARRQSNGWAIPNGTSNTDAAYQLIDFSLRPDIQAAYAEIYPNGPVVPEANSLLSEATQKNLLSAPQNLELGFDMDVQWWDENQDAVQKRWGDWARA